ncbi:MAG: hypothetical protein ABL893_05070 [Hyphomicrobium sp.]|nr:hypothetical protein [Hyphomicrobium sp.]
MAKSYFAMLAVAAGVALSSLAAAPANALPVAKSITSQHSDVVQVRHGGMRHGGLGMRHGGHHRPHFRNFYGPRFYAAPVYTYRSYGDGCYHLKRKALRTGSRYWWRRYNACRWG